MHNAPTQLPTAQSVRLQLSRCNYSFDHLLQSPNEGRVAELRRLNGLDHLYLCSLLAARNGLIAA